jgi:Tfp pilus assembly protein PilE
MAPRKTKKEQIAHRRAALQKKAAAQGSKAMEPEVSLQGDKEESTSRLEACEVTTNKEEGSIQSNKDSKRKSTPPNIQATK